MVPQVTEFTVWRQTPGAAGGHMATLPPDRINHRTTPGRWAIHTRTHTRTSRELPNSLSQPEVSEGAPDPVRVLGPGHSEASRSSGRVREAARGSRAAC
ncbi:hypothetical protein GCM10010502_06690 [Kitasatospora aureofaciens]|uniref:Uncharacterized protein n=1 Tax=Kitasatospora aureofaciens TaxID=1894 RepID=A0A8H9LKX2_KITAU|nr:hypothetical protein GCM10010502_06690 [Kitasatospora aureofaciens]